MHLCIQRIQYSLYMYQKKKNFKDFQDILDDILNFFFKFSEKNCDFFQKKASKSFSKKVTGPPIFEKIFLATRDV